MHVPPHSFEHKWVFSQICFQFAIIKLSNLKLWCLMTKDSCCENMLSASDSGWGNMLPLISCLTCSIWGQQQQCGSENWKSDEVKSESDLLLQKLFKDVAMHWQTFLPCLLINSISLIACHPGNPRVVISWCRRKRTTSSSGPCGYHKTFDCKKKGRKVLGVPVESGVHYEAQLILFSSHCSLVPPSGKHFFQILK